MSKGLKFYISKALRKYLSPPAVRDSKFDATVRIWDHSTIDQTSIGRFSYVSDHTLISDCEIGSFCSISSYCQIGGASHPMDYVSTSPVFLEGHNPWDRHIAELEYSAYKKTYIGNDVWIGTHAIIKGGVFIGDGAVIGMGSVVTHDVAPYSVVAGVPAKEIRKRFGEKTIQKLLALEWWNWPDEKLKKYGIYFGSPEKLFQALNDNQ